MRNYLNYVFFAHNALSVIRNNPEVHTVLFNLKTQDVEKSQVDFVDVECIVLVLLVFASLEDIHVKTVRIVGSIVVSSFEENLIDFISLFKLNQFNINETQFENIIRSISSEWDYDSLGENSKILIEKLNENEETFIEVIPNYENLDNPNEILKLFKKFFAYNKFSATTGVVIAGFNKDRLFPSYVEFKISYLFDDIFTFKEEDYMNLIGNDVLVKPLAQDDVIDTFLGNMDKRTRNMLTGYVNSIHEMYGVYLKEAITNNSNLTEEEKQKFVNEISKIESANDLLNNSFEEFLNQLKDQHANPILESISALPKEELSNLAESLIKITSLKRKVQPDLDTVGGPVDVAIITRGEGFIWTKRKHYFDGELNPQFFERE